MILALCNIVQVNSGNTQLPQTENILDCSWERQKRSQSIQTENVGMPHPRKKEGEVIKEY